MIDQDGVAPSLCDNPFRGVIAVIDVEVGEGIDGNIRKTA